MPDDTNNNSLPMFYKNPVILNAKEHAYLALTERRKYSFAAHVNSVPVVLGEVPRLLPHYPVVFTSGENPVLMAILGVHNNENLFVDAEGNWREGVYIPAYIRRYPFILSRFPDDKLILAADLDPEFFTAQGQALFQDDKPTQMTSEIYRFCAEYQRAWDGTQRFCQEVQKSGILKQKSCTLTAPDGKTLRLTGFVTAEEEALDALDNHTVNDWRKKHVLKFLYYHLASLDRLGDFLPYLKDAPAAAPAPESLTESVPVPEGV